MDDSLLQVEDGHLQNIESLDGSPNDNHKVYPHTSFSRHWHGERRKRPVSFGVLWIFFVIR